MSHKDPSISFLSSPESHLSGLVYLFFALYPALPACAGDTTTESAPSRMPSGTAKIAGPIEATSTVDAPKVSRTTGTSVEEKRPTPAYPTAPLPLRVPGFAEAVHVAPTSNDAGPKPVIVVLHGNFDRPEWQCETWRHVAAFYGWIVCPRGIPTPWANKSEDRWTYRGSTKTDSEIDATITALENRYPGEVASANRILVGFSLGAILAPAIAISRPDVYKAIFMVEGGVEKLDRPRIRALTRAGVKAFGFAMSTARNRAETQKRIQMLQRAGVHTVYVDMAGAGHDYLPDFVKNGKEAFSRLLSTLSPGASRPNKSNFNGSRNRTHLISEPSKRLSKRLHR